MLEQDKETEATEPTVPRTLKTIAVYGYHPDTLEPLRCVLTADESPLDEDVYLLPQYTTRTEPLPNKDGYVQRYDAGHDAWQYLRTWRDVPLYHTDTGLPYHVSGEGWDGLGELPDKLTDLPPPSPAHDWDAKKSEWVLNKSKQAALEAEQAAAAESAWRDELDARMSAAFNVASALDYSNKRKKLPADKLARLNAFNAYIDALAALEYSAGVEFPASPE